MGIRLDFLKEGGAITSILLVMGTFVVLCFLERLLYYHQRKIYCPYFLSGVENLIRKKKFLEALTLCEETRGPVAGVVKVILMKRRESERDIRSAIEQVASVFIADLERRLALLQMIAKLAPLLGILGTLIALLGSFNLLEQHGPYVEVLSFSGYMRSALLSSVVGLAVAILSWASFAFLNARLKSFIWDIDYTGVTLINFLKDRHSGDRDF